MDTDYKVTGKNASALFTLTLHRGEGMSLVAMNWKQGKPTRDFVGFAIEYKEPNGTQFFPLTNRLNFPGASATDPNRRSTLRSPIQKWRWVHFPFHPDIPGLFTYRVTPIFMDKDQKLSHGESQTAQIALADETYPGRLNVCFTRGFVSSQAFVDKYLKDGPINTLVCPKAKDGLTFKSTHADTAEALPWMGFEAYKEIVDLLDKGVANADAQVRVIGYDFNEPDVVSRLKKMKHRVKVIIDDSKDHGNADSAETSAATMLTTTAGAANVLREKMGNLQHNKTIIVDSVAVKKVICGSTNLSWRGFFVQNNNAVVLTGDIPVQIFKTAFDNFWQNKDNVAGFGATASAKWNDLQIPGIDAKVAFSPHIAGNALLQSIGDDIENNTKSSVLYSLAFLYETGGAVHDAVKKVTNDPTLFVYGISDKKDDTILVKKPDSVNPAPVFAVELKEKKLPAPFKTEISGGQGTRMHHKFVVIDFEKPTARVYLGSYNFSSPADVKNGENLLIIKDRKVVTSYMIEALRIFDHYEWRVAQLKADKTDTELNLKLPPAKATTKTWFDEDFTNARKIRDREIFSSTD